MESLANLGVLLIRWQLDASVFPPHGFDHDFASVIRPSEETFPSKGPAEYLGNIRVQCNPLGAVGIRANPLIFDDDRVCRVTAEW